MHTDNLSMINPVLQLFKWLKTILRLNIKILILLILLNYLPYVNNYECTLTLCI